MYILLHSIFKVSLIYIQLIHTFGKSEQLFNININYSATFHRVLTFYVILSI